MARLTLAGMYNWDPTLFDQMVLPPGVNASDMIQTILERSGDLYPYYQVPPKLKTSIGRWSRDHLSNFTKIAEALAAEYNPIHNYDRLEERTGKVINSGTDTDIMRESGTDTDTIKYTGTDINTSVNSGTDSVSTKKTGSDTVKHDLGSSVQTTGSNSQTTTNKVAAFDNTSLLTKDQQEVSGTSSSTDARSGSDTDTTTYNTTESSTNTLGSKNVTSLERSTTDTHTLQHGKTDTHTFDHGHVQADEYTLKVAGNIGVTTSQQMIESEINLRTQYMIYDIIADEFEEQFIVRVY